MNCGNQVAEKGRKNKKRKKKKKNCDNQVAENEGKKKRCYVHNIFTSFSQQITGS